MSHELRAAIYNIANPRSRQQEGVLVDGIVTAVDKDADTCDFAPYHGGAPVIGVKLSAFENDGTAGSDIVIYPAINSAGIIAFINNENNNALLISCAQVESARIKMAGALTIVVNSDGTLVFNSGSNAGLVNIAPLVSKINNLENTVNSHLIAYKAHTHTGVSVGGSITGPATPTGPAAISPITQQSDLEDTKIKH